jgi:hypothetical protein
MPEVIDHISRSAGIKDANVAIHFEGFQPDEVRLAVRSAEIRTKAHVAGVVKPAPEFATRPLDFGNAELRPVQIKSYADGAGEVGHVIEVPGVKPFTIEVKVALRDAPPGLLERLGNRIQNFIQSLVNRFSGRPITPQDFGIELRRGLQDLLREELQDQMNAHPDAMLEDLHWLELKMKQETSDFTIVQRERPARHGTRDLTF